MESQGEVTPLSDKPEQDGDVEWFIHSFGLLSESRQFTQAGPAPIPLSEYNAFFQLYDAPFEKIYVLTILRKMDHQWITSFTKDAKND